MLEKNLKLIIAFLFVIGGIEPIQAQTIDRFLPEERPVVNTKKQIDRQIFFSAPPPPDNIGEPGRRSDAGSRGSCLDREGSLTSATKSLTALVPVYKSDRNDLVLGVTTSARPTFWFYVPYDSFFTGELIVRDTEGNLVYKTKIEPLPKPGFVSISLPKTEPGLEIGKLYQWFFKIYCNSEDPSTLSFVSGWIERKSLNSSAINKLNKATMKDKLAFYADRGIWYEALMTAFKLNRLDRNDSNWSNLLKTVGLENIVAEPVSEFISQY
jgi:hypothetical protein